MISTTSSATRYYLESAWPLRSQEQVDQSQFTVMDESKADACVIESVGTKYTMVETRITLCHEGFEIR